MVAEHDFDQAVRFGNFLEQALALFADFAAAVDFSDQAFFNFPAHRFAQHARDTLNAA